MRKRLQASPRRVEHAGLYIDKAGGDGRGNPSPTLKSPFV